VRLFVAVCPPAAAIEHLDAFVSGLAVGQPTEAGRSVRLVSPDRWHLTLAFIGDVPDAKAEPARKALALARERFDQAAPELSLAGGGRFGRGRFTIMWVGVRGHVDGLRALATAVRYELRVAKLPFDPKPLRPHLTLARPGQRLPAQAISADLAALAGYEGPQWTTDSVVLMRSTLGPKPVYDVLATEPV
jgi:2'-5' RNA ligase